MTDKPTPKGIYLTTYAGTPFYVNERGTFSCTYRGEEMKRSSLSDLKRRIRGREVVPIRYMTDYEIRYGVMGMSRTQHIVAQDANHPDFVHSDTPDGVRLKLGDVYHFDQTVIDESRALYAQEKALRDQREGLITKLRPITRSDLVPKGKDE
jgi:hypothetical protein